MPLQNQPTTHFTTQYLEVISINVALYKNLPPLIVLWKAS